MNTIETTLHKRIAKQLGPIMLFVDIDGTLFTAGWRIIKAPFYNAQTMRILKKQSIPLILVTGRQTWNKIFEQELPLHGVDKADCVIAGAGTEIFVRQSHGELEKDREWAEKMLETQVTWTLPNEKPFTQTWDKQQITEFLKEYRVSHKIKLSITKGNNHLVRLFVEDMKFTDLNRVIQDLHAIWRKGITIDISEKLLRDNTTQIFTGDMLVMPETAGKDKAVAHILEQYAKTIKKKITGIIFGDATIDIPMLVMKDHKQYFSLQQYCVHPTPHAKDLLDKTNPTIITEQEGPQTILQVVKRYDTQFSAAQNSSIRKVEKFVEPVLNLLVDPKLSANEVSLLGLQKVKTGIDSLHQKNPIKKLQGTSEYLYGNLADVLDGVRARRKGKESNGQLVDGFCDRAKEFYQLYNRGAKRTMTNKKEGMQTFLAALSCSLPSIARAQAEIQNIVVPEKDNKGGSMIDRTKLLFASLFFETINLDHKSYEIDTAIYQRNIATFENRLSYQKNTPANHSREGGNPELLNSVQGKTTEFQLLALERFLLYVEILQEENKIINFTLRHSREGGNPELLNSVQDNKIKEQIKVYLQLNISKLREKYNIKDYQLHLANYLFK